MIHDPEAKIEILVAGQTHKISHWEALSLLGRLQAALGPGLANRRAPTSEVDLSDYPNLRWPPNSPEFET